MSSPIISAHQSEVESFHQLVCEILLDLIHSLDLNCIESPFGLACINIQFMHKMYTCTTDRTIGCQLIFCTPIMTIGHICTRELEGTSYFSSH